MIRTETQSIAVGVFMGSDPQEIAQQLETAMGAITDVTTGQPISARYTLTIERTYEVHA